MKTALLLLLFGIPLYAQTYTEKYNNLNNRYEYFNSSNQMVGYKQYNSLKNSWDYYDVNVQPQYAQPVQTFDANLAYQALAQKQANADYGVNAVQKTLDNISETILKISNPTIRENVTKRYTECVDYLNAQRYDYSNQANVRAIIDWFYKSIQDSIKFEFDKYQKEQDAVQKVQQDLNDVDVFKTRKGGYYIAQVKHMTSINNSTIVTDSITKNHFLFYYEGATIYFKTGVTEKWRYRELTFQRYEKNLNSYIYTSGNDMVLIDKDFKTITLWSPEMNGKTKGVELTIGVYSNAIKHD